MMAHIVYFWAKPDLSVADKQKFEAGMNTLLKIKAVKMGYVGKPASTTQRDVVDSSYTYSLFLFFDDVKGHDAYQIDPIHLAFVEGNKQFWTKVVIYDSDTM
ncbi:MAG: Dabb family protein [Cytophagales bacterium]|nr:MAG: Dabb family protein [Cytophagales bacterium]